MVFPRTILQLVQEIEAGRERARRKERGRKEEGEREEDRRRGWEIEEMTSGNSSGQPESQEGEPRTGRFKDQFRVLL